MGEDDGLFTPCLTDMDHIKVVKIFRLLLNRVLCINYC